MHFIYVKGRDEPAEAPICTVGSGHEAIDDIGGTFGFERLKKIYNKEKRTAYEKESVRRYENIYFGDVLGLGNSRERVWDKDDVNEKLIELKTRNARKSSVSDLSDLSSSEMADLTEKMIETRTRAMQVMRRGGCNGRRKSDWVSENTGHSRKC